MWRALSEGMLTGVVSAVYWVWSRTWRLERVGYPRGTAKGPFLWAHWHGDELLFLGTETYRGLTVMTSHSRDGERMGRLVRWLGYRIVRGSSSRGGAGGLKGMIDAVRHEGGEASLAVDGPRGPIFRVKPGILKLAQETGAPIVPGAAAADRRFVFRKAWNQSYLPWPFARCVAVYGEPLRVPAEASAAELETARRFLEQRLMELKIEAEAHFARDPHPALAMTPREKSL